MGGPGQATVYHVPDGIPIFSEGENGQQEWSCERHIKEQRATAAAETKMVFSCKSSTQASMHMAASPVTSCSVQGQVYVESQRTKPWQPIGKKPV